MAERAGVSVGSLYQYFPSKEAIVAELIRRMRQEMLADFEAAARRTADSTLAEAADALIEASLRHHLRRPALAQALEREEEHLTLDTETRALKAGMHALLVEVLERHGVADVERTAFDLSALSRGMIEAALRAGQSDLDELRRRILRAILGYLGLPHPRAAPTGLAADR